MTITTTSRPARRQRASDFSDAVVAAYIHEISARHQPSHASKGRRRGGKGSDPQGRSIRPMWDGAA